jgi:hypothetical protein
MKRQEAGEICILRSSLVFTFHQILLGSDQEGEIGGACSMHGRCEVCLKIVGW